MGTNLKDYQKGTIRFKDQKVEVNVLQIMGNTDSSSLKKVTNMKQSYLETDDYKINIDVTKMTKFNESSGAYSHTKINGVYDMLIFGFQDSYNQTAQINKNAVSSLNKFIETNQSIMFTHDTIFETGNNWVNNFMDDTGQKQPHTNLGYGAPSTSRTTLQVNKGLITTYPFQLDENVDVALTHNQYYTLDLDPTKLEDPLVIPWYNITGSNRDPYDSYNHYYTYSKGNITYSGTGHLGGGFPDEEQKLFVNTMYRAFLGSNHAPVLTVFNPIENEIIPAHQNIELSYQIQDFDLKDTIVSTKVFLNGVEVRSNPNVTNGSTIVESIAHGMPNGGNATLKIVAMDSQGAESEVTINLKIEEIKANLEVSRTLLETKIFEVNNEVKLKYLVNPKMISGEAATKITEDEITLKNVTYTDTFPANLEVVAPEGFKRTGTLEEGYTITGKIPEIKYTKKGSGFVAIPFNYEVSVIPKKKGTFTLNNAQITYPNINGEQETVKFNPITIQSEYALESISLPDNIVINKGMPKNLALDLVINPKEAGIKEIVWSVTQGSSILSVDPKTGVVTANSEGNGEVTVTVTDVFGNVKTTKTYISVRIPVENIEVSNITLKVGETKPLPIKITP